MPNMNKHLLDSDDLIFKQVKLEYLLNPNTTRFEQLLVVLTYKNKGVHNRPRLRIGDLLIKFTDLYCMSLCTETPFRIALTYLQQRNI